MTYALQAAADPGAAHDAILARLIAFNRSRAGDPGDAPFALTLTRDGDPEIHGGLWAEPLWGSFYIALVFVPEDARGQGMGTALMARAEAEARARGCRQMWLDTFAFQARPFYERLGFKVFGQIDGPPPAFPRWFMQKRLDGGAPAPQAHTA